jgi:hypothetical protein
MLTMDRSCSFTELCELLEQSPSIRWIRVSILFNGDEEVLFRIELDCDNNDFAINDQSFEADAWRRFGRAVRSIALDELRLWSILDVGDSPPSASRCIDTFINEGKHNKSIVCIDADIDFLTEASMDVLGEFIQSNITLKN